MAQSDLDNMPVAKDFDPVEAQDNLVEDGSDLLAAEDAAAAQAAGVKRASFVGYDAALVKYEDRDDVESLARKNARNNPADFNDADFMRAAGTGYVGSGD